MCAEDAATLADALVYDAPGEAGEAHWNEEAKALIAGILLYIVAEEPPERRTLATLREYLTCAPDAFATSWSACRPARRRAGWSPAPPIAISAKPTARPPAFSPPPSAIPISSIARA